MKYAVILMDGMADEPIRQLGGKTPLAYAKTKMIDALAPFSEIGMVHTIPEGCTKGSDTANLCVLGYNPKKYYFGRSPLEALSMGIPLKDTDVTFRVNLVTLSEGDMPYEERRIIDHSSDEIETEEAKMLLQTLAEQLKSSEYAFYPGVSYRHLLVWDKGSRDVHLMAPHDILEKPIKDYKPVGVNSDKLWEMMKKSYAILKDHPVNQERKKRGLRPANGIWIWGEGIKPQLPSFKEKYHIDGAVISAVDLIKGIGIGAGMTSIDVEGATGNVHTNYDGKAQAAIKWLIDDDKDFVYVHLEGPDECGHRGEVENKVRSIELIDEKILTPLKQALDKTNEPYRILVLPDHPTPIRLRTHTDDSIPYMIFDSRETVQNPNKIYTESFAKTTGLNTENGYELMNHFLLQ